MTNFTMIKKIFTLLILVLFCLPNVSGENRAYKVLWERSLWEFKNDRAERNRIGTIMKGDTVYAMEETAAYIAEHEAADGIDYIPVEYKGKRGFVENAELYPIRLAETDTLRYLYEHAEGKRDFTERFLGPARTPVMNLPVNYVGWLMIVLVGIIASGVCFAFWSKFKSPLLILSAAVLLAAASAAEMVYMLSVNNTIWFLMPSVVGGWGKTILYFIVMSLAIVGQFVLFLMIWTESRHGKGLPSRFSGGRAKLKLSSGVRQRTSGDYYDEDEDDDSQAPPAPDVWNWVDLLAFIPVLVGVALMVIIWVDYFKDNTLSMSIWLWTLAPIPAAALCGLVSLIKKGKIAEGIVIPLCFIISGIGIAISIMHLSMMIIFVIIVAVAVGAALLFGLSALGAAFGGGERVTGYLPDGTRVTGTKDGFGNVRGDDGKTYKIN